jgi:hypothetical protein
LWILGSPESRQPDWPAPRNDAEGRVVVQYN